MFSTCTDTINHMKKEFSLKGRFEQRFFKAHNYFFFTISSEIKAILLQAGHITFIISVL